VEARVRALLEGAHNNPLKEQDHVT
jgi:hypothetical protein